MNEVALLITFIFMCAWIVALILENRSQQRQIEELKVGREQFEKQQSEEKEEW